MVARGERADYFRRIPLVVQHREPVLEEEVVVGPPAVAVEYLGPPGVAVGAGREETERAVAFDVEVIPVNGDVCINLGSTAHSRRSHHEHA